MHLRKGSQSIPLGIAEEVFLTGRAHHIPSPVQARQHGIPMGPAQVRRRCETLYERSSNCRIILVCFEKLDFEEKSLLHSSIIKGTKNY